jgi:hypothetical protein
MLVTLRSAAEQGLQQVYPQCAGMSGTQWAVLVSCVLRFWLVLVHACTPLVCGDAGQSASRMLSTFLPAIAAIAVVC